MKALKIKLLDEIKKNSLIKSRSSYKDFKIQQEKEFKNFY